MVLNPRIRSCRFLGMVPCSTGAAGPWLFVELQNLLQESWPIRKMLSLGAAWTSKVPRVHPLILG